MNDIAKYFKMALVNDNKTISNSIPLIFDKTFTPIRDIDNLGDYDLYLNNIIITNVEIPYRNFYNDIKWNLTNFTTNKTNLSISLYDSGGYNFNLTGNTNTLITGIDADPGNPNLFKGVCCFIQFYSENSPLPNPGNVGFTSSLTYPRTYFNLHSLQHFLDMVNVAISTCLSKHATLSASNLYLYYDSTTLLYNLIMDNTIKTSTVDLFMNTFLSRFLDGFRSIYLAPTDVTNVAYTGMSYKISKANYAINNVLSGGSNYWIYKAEKVTINNLSDVISIMITSDGSLGNTRPQIFCNVNDNQSTLEEKRILKILDFIYDNGSGNDNSVIEFENIVMDKPINLLTCDKFNNIKLNFYIITTTLETIPLNLNPDGTASIGFTLKKKKI